MRCADELPEGVVGVDGRRNPVLEHVAIVRQDGSHAGADVIRLDKRDLPDAHASDIGDGVERTRLVNANLDAQVAHPQAALRTARGFLRRDVASQRQKDGCTGNQPQHHGCSRKAAMVA